MKNLAIFCVVLLGCASVAGATVLTMDVTTASAADTLNLGISETITTNVGTLIGGSFVNEIDVRVTSIGGTYNFGASVIPPDAGINGLAGLWSFSGGVAYLPSTKTSGALTGVAVPDNGNGGTAGSYSAVGNTDYPGYWSPGRTGSVVNFDANGGNSPGFASTTTGAGIGNNTFAATGIGGQWATNYTLCNVGSVQQTGWTGPDPTATTFDNTLLAVFYVSPSTQYATFYTTDGNPWNVDSSNNHFSQFGFNYGGGRTDYVQIAPRLHRRSRRRWPCWPPGWSASWPTPGRSAAKKR